MKQHMFSLVSALLLAAPLTSAAQQQLQQLKPNELATNLAGVTTIAAPPKGFNPLTASDQDLEYYGFPPRPNEVAAAKALATWQKAMALPRLASSLYSKPPTTLPVQQRCKLASQHHRAAQWNSGNGCRGHTPIAKMAQPPTRHDAPNAGVRVLPDIS